MLGLVNNIYYSHLIHICCAFWDAQFGDVGFSCRIVNSMSMIGVCGMDLWRIFSIDKLVVCCQFRGNR